MKISVILLIMASNTLLQQAEAQKMDVQKKYNFYKKLYSKLEKGSSAADLEKQIPHLRSKIKNALEVSKQFWADSVTFDELAKTDILPTRILDKLGIPHEETTGVVHVPAGLMHTYGYVFSQLDTKFGKKSKRWIESRLDERMGLLAGLFDPIATSGEFLDNLTKALFRAVRGENAKAPHLGFLEEDVEWENGKHAKVRTHFIKLLPMRVLKVPNGHVAPESDVSEKLLVYEVEFAGEAPHFVTAFPVNDAFMNAITAMKRVDNHPFVPRYNWYVDPAWKVKSAKCSGYMDETVNP